MMFSAGAQQNERKARQGGCTESRTQDQARLSFAPRLLHSVRQVAVRRQRQVAVRRLDRLGVQDLASELRGQGADEFFL